MAQHPQPPAKPPAQPQHQPQHQPPREANRQNPPAPRAGGQGEPDQPLRPPLPPATSAPPRQPPPNPTPVPDEPPHDQRYQQGAFGVDRETLTPEQRTRPGDRAASAAEVQAPVAAAWRPRLCRRSAGERGGGAAHGEGRRGSLRFRASRPPRMRNSVAWTRAPTSRKASNIAGTPGKKQPDKEGEPLHQPGHHKGDDKDK